MAEIKWIKITTDMFDDEKIDFISSLPEGDSLIVVWVRLLTMAGKNNAGGFIFLTENIPYSEDMLSNKFKKPLNVIKLALRTFKDLEMIDFDESGRLFISNWEKHQNIEALDKIREQTRLRVAKYRELKQLECNVTVTEEVTDGNAIDKDKDKDKEELIINVIPEDATKNERTILNYLKGVTGYTIDYKKDLAFIRELSIDFPKANILEKIKEWNLWIGKHPLTKKSNPRLQIRNWVKPKEWGKGGSKFGTNRKFAGQAKTNAEASPSTPSRSRKASEWED